MESAGNPDTGQFGDAATSYQPGQMINNQSTNGPYSSLPPSSTASQNPAGQLPNNQPYPPSYVVTPMYLSCPQNQSISSTPYQPGTSQQITYIIGTVQPVVVTQQYVPVNKSYAGHFVFAGLVFWFCWWLFGGIAFILALVARSSSRDGHHMDAKRLGQASLALSSVGLVLGLVAWGLFIWRIYFVPAPTSSDSGNDGGGSGCSYYGYYTCDGNCYKYRSYCTSAECYSYYSSSCYSSSTGYCYYDN